MRVLECCQQKPQAAGAALRVGAGGGDTQVGVGRPLEPAQVQVKAVHADPLQDNLLRVSGNMFPFPE